MQAEKIKILLVEDDVSMGFLLAEYLEDNNFDVKLYRDGESGLKAWGNSQFDFCIFDIMLPKQDGFSLAKKVREASNKTPIILLTAKSMKEDKIKGFHLGIDDYITKPFDEEELLCRINAVLMRTIPDKGNKAKLVYNIGAYQFDFNNHALIYNGATKRLTKKESEIMQMLCSSKNSITKRNEILQTVWGRNDYFTGRSLDVFITKLRKHLAKDPVIKLESIPRVGYILADK